MKFGVCLGLRVRLSVVSIEFKEWDLGRGRVWVEFKIHFRVKFSVGNRLDIMVSVG